MKPENLSEDQLARKLASVQEEVTGLSDNALPQTGSENDSVSRDDRQLNAEQGDELSGKLASAKKVMQLLEKMRPNIADLGETMENFDTPVISANTDSFELKIPESTEIPETIGRFEILSMLGHGGFSLVFKAHDPILNRIVALKVPTLDSLLKSDVVARFQQESRAVATLSHPNIVPVFEVGNDGPISFIATAFIEGSNLAEWVRKNGVMAPRQAAIVMSVIAEAIQHAHDRGIVHRDLKPANILVKHLPDQNSADQPNDETGLNLDPSCIHVADFGLAKITDVNDLTKTGSLLGTPAYSAPEQLSTEARSTSSDTGDSSHSADVYSMGAILYFLLTGNSPHQAPDLLELIQQVKANEPVSPASAPFNAPIELAAICLKSLEKTPGKRYCTAYEFGRDLNHFLKGKPVIARPVGKIGRSIRWCRRNPVVATLSFVTLAAILAGSIASAWSTRNANIASQHSRQQYLESKRVIDKFYVQVSRDPMFLSPSFHQQKRKLLETAKRQYVEFLKVNAGDEDLAVDLIRTEIYLAQSEMEGDQTAVARDRFAKCLADIEKKLTAQPNSDELRLLKATALRGIGSIELNSGEMDKAQLSLETAKTIFESLLPDKLDDQEFAFQFVQVYQSLVHFHRAQGERQKSNLYSKQQQVLLETLAAQTELNSTLQNYYAMSLGDQSLFHRDQGQPVESLELLNRSIEVSERLVSNEPNPVWFAETAIGSLYRRAVLRVREGKMESALIDANRCSELAEALSIHNRTDQFSDFRIGIRNLLAVCLKETGEEEKAMEMSKRNLNEARILAARNPNQNNFQISLAVKLIQLESALIDSRQLNQALELNGELALHLQSLNEKNIRNPLLERLSIANVIESGRISHRRREYEMAVEKFDEAYRLVDQKREANPLTPDLLGLLASIHDNRAFSFLQLRNLERAIDDRRQAAELDRIRPEFQKIMLAEVLAQSGKIDEAQTVLSEVIPKLVRNEVPVSEFEMFQAFVHGAISIELTKRTKNRSGKDELLRNAKSESKLAESHFLRAVDLGYFEGKPLKYLGIRSRPHMRPIFELPSILPILDRQKVIWESYQK